MSKKTLTVRKVESRKLKAKPGEREDHRDAVVPGLALRVTSTGHKSYVLITRYPGSPNPTRRVLGCPGRITLEQAREKARAWLELIERGIDPAAEARKRRVDASKRVTFDELRTAFLKYFEQKKKHGEAARILTKDFAAWNGRLASDIDAQDVDEAIHVIVARGSKYQAINAFGYVRSMYSWGMGQPRLGIKASPCANLSSQTLIGKKRPRTRVLVDAELRAIWNACDDEKCIYPYGQIVKLLILTAVRENEIACMSRRELHDLDDETKALLVVPSDRMKGEEDDPPPPHEIPLTPRMISIIESMPPLLGGPYVFSTTGGEKPVNGWSKAKSRLDELSGVRSWIFHDLRRSVRTRVSAIPAEEHVREALLAHGRRGIQAHYDQHKYRDEKRALLDQWERRLMAIVEPPPNDVADLAAMRRTRAASA